MKANIYLKSGQTVSVGIEYEEYVDLKKSFTVPDKQFFSCDSFSVNLDTVALILSLETEE